MLSRLHCTALSELGLRFKLFFHVAPGSGTVLNLFLMFYYEPDVLIKLFY